MNVQSARIQQQNNIRARRWCFTLNNYSDEERASLLDSFSDTGRAQQSIQYVCIGYEVGDSGTPHVQGFLCFKRPISLLAVKRIPGMQRCHLETCKGSVQQNRDYCSKDGDFHEFGTVPEQGKRSDLERVAALVNEGKDPLTISEECPVEFIKFHKGISALMSLRSGYRQWKTEVYWYWGPTGTGKSREAFAKAMDAESFYVKDPSNKWWDGYNGQKVVVIDDFRRDFCTFSFLLRLFDEYPMSVEVKGATVNFLAEKIYLTTPKNPVNTWEGRTEEDLAQLTRRITQVVHFDTFGVTH